MARGFGGELVSRWSKLLTASLAISCGGGGSAEGGDGASSNATGTGSTSEASEATGNPTSATETSATETTAQPETSATDTAPTDPTTDPDSGSSGGTGESFDDHCGALLFAEPFEDTDFEARGWYDGPSATLSNVEMVRGSSASFECRFPQGANVCEGGTPGRHGFDPQQAVCLRYWVKYSENWVGSGQPYHPHEFHFVTNLDDDYVGPANTRLTLYVEQVGGTPRLALQDSVNVDLNCVLLNNDTFVGCDGSFDDYPFTEARSVAACNGLAGVVEGRDCFSTGNGYYSARFWDSPVRTFGDAAPWDKNDWHLVESYWRMNGIENGIGVPDGQIRYWVDGELLVSHDEILLRTGQHPDMAFDQFLVAPYIGDGSPLEQTMWVDDLEVYAGL